MNTIGFTDISPATFNMHDLLQWIRNNNSETIIYLDNADDILRPGKPSRDDFTNFLRELIQECNQRTRFLITTRYKIDKVLCDCINFHALDLKPLKVLDAISLLRRSSELSSIDDEVCKSLVFVCGHNPHAIRAVASRLKQGHIKPKALLEILRQPVKATRVFHHRYDNDMSVDGHEMEQQEGVLKCLRVLFNQLDKNYKKYLIKLSVFPSFFYEDVAAVILDEDKSMISFYLQKLCVYGVLEFEELGQFINIASNTYNMHTLLKLTCVNATEEDDSLRQFRDTAMAAFLKHYHQVINEICELANLNFKEGLERYQNDKINLIQYLEHEAHIQSRQTAKDLDFSKEDRRYVIFDGLVEADRRVEYFEIVSRKAKQEEDWISYSFLCGWLGDQYICQSLVLEAHKAVDNGLKTLEKLNSSEKNHRNAMIAKAACLYVKGRAFTGQQKYNDSLIPLKKSLALRQEYEGDHTMTARVLNAIGHVFYRQKKISDSQYYHQEAWEMIRRITHDKPEVHLDSSVYVMNLGTCFRSSGKAHMDAKEPEKGTELYNKALEWFNIALEMQQTSFPGLEIELAAKILKNRALCHFELEDYMKALPDAEKSLNITKRILKDNPDTARCLYFVGTTHHNIGKKILKSTEVSEDERADADNHFGLALKSLEDAYNMEHKLGPHRRSIDYEDIKKEIVDVLKSMGRDADETVQSWERKFAETDNQDTREVYHKCYENIGPPRSPPGALADDAVAESSLSFRNLTFGWCDIV
ncbi:uncharacterized protein LOC117109310 [Anneissia japonica]|uniref:uncharacterized protein LOC117109310 n=1 Tax=Anneissia japonica TaxID=1529436 RepID=UPI001425B827|nr:uncharacterized protein LOC117109310 [Anneissia japonica]